jgi:hypothetical protein
LNRRWLSTDLHPEVVCSEAKHRLPEPVYDTDIYQDALDIDTLGIARLLPLLATLKDASVHGERSHAQGNVSPHDHDDRYSPNIFNSYSFNSYSGTIGTDSSR